MQKRMRHSKFRNTGILYELLTRQVTSDVIAGKDSSLAMNLLYKYFNENTSLGKEWHLYSTLINEKIKDETHSQRFFDIILNSRKKINNKMLSNEKYNLIKEIKDNYSIDEMLTSPIRNYKLLASIYKAFEDIVAEELKFDTNEILQAKNCIIEHICDNPKSIKRDDEILTFYEKQSEEIRLLSYKLLVEKLNDKYASELDDEQRSILREYIYNVSNSNKFGDYIKKKIGSIKVVLKELLEKIEDSDVTKIKIQEVVNQLDKINPGKNVKDNHVMVLMLSHELLKEIKNKLGDANAKHNKVV